MADKRSFGDRFWNDREGHFVAWQRPNAALWIWLAATAINLPLKNPLLSSYLSFLGKLSLVIWAVLEILTGASYFRRLLGLSVLLFTVVMGFWS